MPGSLFNKVAVKSEIIYILFQHHAYFQHNNQFDPHQNFEHQLRTSRVVGYGHIPLRILSALFCPLLQTQKIKKIFPQVS